MKLTLVIQIILSLIMIILVALQSNESSLGSSFSSATKSGIHTKRGPEKMIYILTIVVAVVFVLFSFLNIAFWK
ncbi:MAG TPA: preprotein translocase subunit SecG [Candidatus Woesebacteria bacterium]|nr:preprotein translocase subunit SecG [Candidatus Woesebacteria bacterium]